VNFFSFGECNRSWLNSNCHRTASRWARRGSSKPSSKTSLLMCFDNKWIASKSMSTSAVTNPIDLQITEFF
jgi:hypothetical protein